MERPDKTFISVDIETSGFAMPPKHSMLSIGACVTNDMSRRFSIELKPISPYYDPESLKINGLSLETLRANGAESAKAMRQFRDWVVDVSRDADPVFIAMPVWFDWLRIAWYFKHYAIDNPFHEYHDIREYYARFKGLSSCKNITGYELRLEFPPDTPHTHNALEDALSQASIFEKIICAISATSP